MSIFVSVLNAWMRPLAAAGLALGLVGCASKAPPTTISGGAPRTNTSGNFVDFLRRGDLVEVRFSGNPSAPDNKAERIKDDGTISLPLLTEPVLAEGKSAGQLQKDIHDRYVPGYFRHLTVTVNTEERVFIVDGEVKQPDRLYWTGQITVLGAIAAAGGFTDFAARKRVELTRLNGDYHIINAVRARKNPALDLPVIPGDRINVPRRSPFGGS
jgi:polysaccharide export outer membrane protein